MNFKRSIRPLGIVALLFAFSAQLSGENTYPVSSEIATLQSLQNSFRAVSKKVLPVVTEVNVIEVVTQPKSSFPFFGNNREGQQEREFRQPGLGSGVVVRKSGDTVYVLTNNHVVGSADEISIRLYDEREFEAKIVGKDERLDLALVSFTTKEDVPVATLGDSDRLQVGDWALAIGNPYGFEATVTAGIISATGRRPDYGMSSGFTDYIQTDAAVNPGNSGGALANIYGEIVGINSWIASRSGGNVGLGFAIPINVAKRAIEDFLSHGKVVYGWLGVSIADATPQYMPGVREDLKVEDSEGSLITNIYRESPAFRDGLKPGDYVTTVDGKPVRNTMELSVSIGNLPPGEQVALSLFRNGKKMDVAVKLSEREDGDQADANLWPGLIVLSPTDQIKESLDLRPNDKGAVVRQVVPDSAAAIAEVESGDLITKINGRRISDVSDFYSRLNGVNSGDISLTITRKGETLTRIMAQ